MNTALIALLRPLKGETPQEKIRAFRQHYAHDEVQAELWRCFHPRLRDSFKDLDPDTTNQLASLYENIEILVSAVYQLPDMPAQAAGKKPAVNPDATGGTSHG